MIIKTLAENNSISEKFKSEHGLSIYIEANGKKILFDVGASGLFIENSKKLGVNIENVDYLAISHGHADHGGGLEDFFENNKTAKVFIHEDAFDGHYAVNKEGEKRFIGLNKKFEFNEQVVITKEYYQISNGIYLFSNVDPKELYSKANSTLYSEHKGEFQQDKFEHEQSLVIEENGKILLISSCSHKGIVNIVKHFAEFKGKMPDYVIGGFHLFSKSFGGSEKREIIEQIGRELLKTGSKYYTCHCTGLEPYEILKNIMRNKIEYLATGASIEF